MAINSVIPALVLLCCLSLSTQIALGQPLNITNDNELSNKLLNKGYGAMAGFGLNEYLKRLLTSTPSDLTHKATPITVFCPKDEAFINHYGLGPETATILRYHVVPFKVDRNTLESSPVGARFPTFLVDSPPLIKTVVPYTGKVSLNNITILDWEIYEDDKVIVHGVEGFFDPQYPLLHPYGVAKDDRCVECNKNLNDHHDHEFQKSSSNSRSSLSMKRVLRSPAGKGLLIAALVLAVLIILGVACLHCRKKTRDQDLPMKISSDHPLSSVV